MRQFLYLFVCLLMFCPFMNAQEEKSIVIGQTVEGKELTARGVEFDGRVRKYKMDTTATFFMVQLGHLTPNGKSYKNKGELVVFNYQEGKELWRRKMNYMSDQFVFLPEGVLFNSKGVKSFYLDLQTGQERWNKKIFPYVMDHQNGKILSYKNGVTKNLECYEMNSGEHLWTREVPHAYGWNYDGWVNDSTRLIVSDGIHLVNIKDGTGKSYPMVTGTTNYSGAVALGTLGILTGVVAGVSVMPTGGNAVAELTSNMLREDSLLYFASRTQLLCLDDQLNMKWGYPLPEDLTSHSELFVYDDRLYMINDGSGYRGNLRDFSSAYERDMMEVNIGRPFIASFDKNTGKNIYLTQLTKKKDRIEGACLKELRNTLYLLFDDGMSFCQLTDSTEVEVSPWDEKANGKLQGFLSNSFYLIDPDSTSFRKVVPSDSASCFVYNNQYDVFEVDEQMNVIRTYRNTELYFTSLNMDGYSLISQFGIKYLIDFNGKKLATLHLPFDLYLVKDKVYTLDKDRNKILEINRKELFPERVIDNPII